MIARSLRGQSRRLRDSGHDAVHVLDYNLHDAEDRVIFERAAIEDRVIVSADSDFAMLLALRRSSKPSFILFRELHFVRVEDYVSRIAAYHESHKKHKARRALVWRRRA